MNVVSRLRPTVGWMVVLVMGTASLPLPVAAQSGYGGPNILSRSASFQGRGQGLLPLSLRANVQSNFYRTNGLLGVDQNNKIIPGSVSGFGIGGGLYGIQVSRRSQTTFSYSGNYSHVFNINDKFSNGIDQTLVFSHEHQLSRRWGFFTGHSAGTQNSVLRARAVSQQGQFRSNFDESYVNYFEPIDTRLYFINSNAGFFYKASQRLAFSFDGGLFTVRRSLNSLGSARGERAQGEISYRLGPKDNIAILYSYNHFFFLNSFGESFTHAFHLSYGRRINRIWSLFVRGGPYNSQSERLRSVSVDPFIASLIGQTVTLEAFQGTSRGVSAGGGLNGVGRHHSLNINYDRSVNPGNGLTLTALGQTASAYYNYSGIRTLSCGAGFFYSTLTPLLAGLDNANNFGSVGVSAGLSYRLVPNLYLTGHAEVARVRYDSTTFNATRETISIGLAYSPGDLPLKWR